MTGCERPRDEAAGRDAAADVARRAIGTRAALARLLRVAVAVVVARPARQGLARRATSRPGEVVQVIGDCVRLVFSQNSGALFGLFRDQAVLFGLVSLVVIGLIVAYHGRAGTEPATCRSRSGCCSAARSAT